MSLTPVEPLGKKCNKDAGGRIRWKEIPLAEVMYTGH